MRQSTAGSSLGNQVHILTPCHSSGPLGQVFRVVVLNLAGRPEANVKDNLENKNINNLDAEVLNQLFF